VLRGELADNEDSANGTLAAQVVFGRGHDSMYCRGKGELQRERTAAVKAVISGGALS
jgi:hypothetical protein